MLTIGRKDADIVLSDPQQEVSRLHAELTISDDGSYYRTDRGSSNGTNATTSGNPFGMNACKARTRTDSAAIMKPPCRSWFENQNPH